MKKLLMAFILSCSIVAQAQKNTLLEQSFWQAKPDLNLVKSEIEKGANPAELNSNSFDPVVLAINAGAADEVVKYLLTQPGNAIGKLTHDGRIYLHWAAYKGNTELVAYLIDKGSDVKMMDSHGYSPMNFAANAAQQDTKLYDLFISHGVNPKTDLTSSGANVLLLAIAGDKELKLTDYFVSKGLDLNSKDAGGSNAFAYAARAGNIEVLKALVARGVTVDPNAMLMAGEGSRNKSTPLEVYKYLVSLKLKTTQTSKEGRNALHSIVRKANQNEIIQYFLASGIDVNQVDSDGNTPWMNAAAANRDTAVLALLLPKIKNINLANKKGLTALTMAVSNNSAEMVRFLIAKGADVKSIDNSGNKLNYYLFQAFPTQARAMSSEVMADFEAKAKFLQEKGLDLSAPQKDGSTLYHLAVARADMGLFKRLEQMKLDINGKNTEGLTPLHRAAMVAKDDALLKYLLSIGAKKELKTSFGETAYDMASENESLKKAKVAIDFLK